MSLILLVGKKSSGKDTVADYMVNNGWIKVSFAGFLKQSLQILFGLKNEQLWGDKKEIIDDRWGVSPRWLMQTLGTDILREHLRKDLSTKITIKKKEYNFSYHIKRLHQEVQKLLQQNKKIVVADTRFQDEIEWGRLLGGKIIKIIRKDLKLNQYSNHKSEAIESLENIDLILHNDSSLKSLYENVNNIIIKQ